MQTQSYNNFWQCLHKSAKRKKIPLRVMFELTYRCNFQCKHCYVPRSYRKYSELKTEEVFSILDQLKDIGCFYLGFTGGEPFVREDIMDILWYAKKKGFEIIIYTNGSLIDKKRADELTHIRPNKVDVTIPAMSKKTFERISGVSGSRDRVFSAIDLLRKKGVNLGFKTCVLKENEAEINEIQDFAASLGALHRLSDTLVPCLVESGKKARSNKFACGVGINQAAITPLGELKTCLMIQYPKYNILKSSLKIAWEKLKGAVERGKLTGCVLDGQC